MPQLSEFYGIKINMNFKGHEHNPPHVHVNYSGQNATIEIKSKIVNGSLDPVAIELSIRWIEEHEKELLEIWETQEFKQLPPLK